ncbi:MAG: hypothetical protein SFU27_09065 [Thermonemataceae bacterium]|nr:hypothetical protein [Thermonemataceae bacterium]
MSVFFRYFNPFLLLFFFWGIFQPLKAQERCKKVAITQPLKDTLSIIPNSFTFKSNDSTLHLIYDFEKNQAFWRSNQTYTLSDSITVCYRVLPFLVNKKKSKHEIIDTLAFTITPLRPISEIAEKKEEIFSTDSIQKTGAIYRGLAIGNQQNAFVNSALNLQLQGKLSSEITLKASLSDQQVPYQPEGNTQQIQELDRVLIELSSKNSVLQAGDVIFVNKPSAFLRFYKNVQGLQFETKQGYKDSSRSVSSVGVALAKGRFASVALQAQEGVQGPYRLKGASNERFIVVIAATEKVFVDGKLLRRGFDADYVVDYNLAEITFNPNILITQYTRIRVDFEYTERNYSRTNLQAYHSQEFKKLKIFGQFYAETDNPRNPLTLTLSDEQKQRLSEIGDSTSVAFFSSADSVEFSKEIILYEKKDTSTLQGNYSIFVYSQEATKAVWQLSFTEVGFGKGNYQLKQTLQNGRVYEWVEPLNGVPQGSFEPISFVPLPQKRQVFTAGFSYQFSPQERIYVETAFSQRDLNRFSKIADDNNNGMALKISAEQQNRWSWRAYKMENSLSYEFNNPRFLPIDRYRSIEFNRDWNLDLDTTALSSQQEEHIIESQVSLKKDIHNYFLFQNNYRKRNQTLEGWQGRTAFSQKLGKITAKADFFLLSASQLKFQGKSSWQRLFSEIAYQSGSYVLGYNYNIDKNLLRKQNNDSIAFSAMNYDEHKVFFKKTDTTRLQLHIDYSYRTDNQVKEGDIFLATIAQTLQGNLQTKTTATQSFKFLASYRNIANFLQNNKEEENLMGRLEWRKSFAKKNLRSELIWQNTSARELQKEFSYLQVPTGQGTHTWRDDNGNGITELNEFYLAYNLDERQYAKFYTPTDNYIRSFATDINYRFSLQTPTSWAKSKGLKKYVALFSSVNTFLLRRKTTESNFLERLLPFSDLKKEAILSAQENIRSTLFFKRGNPSFGAELNFTKNNQKQLLSSGFEIRRMEEWALSARKGIKKSWLSQVQLKTSAINNESDFLLNRNFQIQSLSAQPQITFQPKNNLRFSLAYLQNYKKNLNSTELAELSEWSGELRWGKAALFTLSAQIRMIDITFNGETASPVAYEMLEALQVGNNLLWTLNYQQRLGNGLQINLLYNGRKTPNNASLIHFGQIQAGVLF